MPAFVAEILTGIFIKNKEGSTSVKGIKVTLYELPAVMSVHPLFQDAICICLASDDIYAKYLDVTLISIKKNRSPSDNYDICILDNGISEKHRQTLLRLSDESFSIRFVHIAGVFADYEQSIFSLSGHFTISTYSRLFLADLFSEYKKILYIDCDLITLVDIATLYKTDLDGHALAATRDAGLLRQFENDKRCKGRLTDYLPNTLKLTNPAAYFQAGVLLLDIEKLCQIDFSNKCITELKRIGKPLLVDQCVLNAVFNGDYKTLEQRWNVLWHISFHKDLDNQLDAEAYADYMNARQHPFIIHYAGSIKPWTSPDVELADKWWHYARQSVFYEQFTANFHQKEIQQLKKEQNNSNKELQAQKQKLNACNMELKQLKQLSQESCKEVLQLKGELDTLRREFQESKRYAKRIARGIVPDRLKPHLKAILRHIPQAVKNPIKRLIHW